MADQCLRRTRGVVYVEALAKAFPLRVINPPIPFVNSVSDLLGATLETPSSPVRQLAKKIFDVMSDTFDERQGLIFPDFSREEKKA
jgi:protein gp37